MRSVAGFAPAVARSQIAKVRRSSKARWRSRSARERASRRALSAAGSCVFDTVSVRELALGRTWSIISMDSRRFSLSNGRGGGVSVRVVVCGVVPFRRVFGALVGPVRWREALVPLRKVEFATLRRDGGRARRKR